MSFIIKSSRLSQIQKGYGRREERFEMNIAKVKPDNLRRHLDSIQEFMY